MAPELIAQLINPDTDGTLSAGSNKKVQWRCPKDSRHTWWASPNTRAKSPRCPVCINRLVIAGVNDLATTHPDLINELVDKDAAYIVHGGSHKKLEWKCLVNPEHPTWEAAVVTRVKGSGCPYCSGRKAVPGVNDLATLHPDYAATLVNPDDAIGVTPRASKKLLWQCQQNPEHTWEVSPHTRLNADINKGCPKCSTRWKRTDKHIRHNALMKTHPELLAEAVDPERVGQLTPGSGVVVSWRCPVAHHGTYEMEVRKKVQGQGCPVCGGRTVKPGVNDLATTHPGLVAELVDPAVGQLVSQGSEVVCQWVCDKNHTWSAPVYSRVAGNGCPYCFGRGTSELEQRFLQAVQVLDPAAQHRYRVHGVECDVLTSHGVGFEINGLFWHCEINKDNTYHVRKSAVLADEGIKLVHVWEDQLYEKPALVLYRAAYLLHAIDRYDQACKAYGVTPLKVGVYNARDTKTCIVDAAQASLFLDTYHLQGATRAVRHLGLRNADGDVVAIMSVTSPGFNARRKKVAGQWEIVRYASAGYVRGGFSKLLKYAEETLDVSSWLSFSSTDVSDGGVYQNNGFVFDGTIPPDYWYTNGIFRNRRVSKQNMTKAKIKDNPQLAYVEGQTEHEAALANNIYRIYDAGKKRWIKQVR